MKIICVVTGYLEENCYIIHNDKFALVIDPGDDSDKIISEIENHKLKVCGILITHYHFDHIGALEDIKNKYKVDVFDYNSPDIIKINCFNIVKINNFGHTMDSCSFLFEKEKIMFTGDFVFNGSIGKYPSKNEIIMYKSLTEFVKYDDDIEIFPGHGPSSTVGEEKKYNYFLRGI